MGGGEVLSKISVHNFVVKFAKKCGVLEIVDFSLPKLFGVYCV